MDPQKLGKKIKLARVELDLTQTDLAKKTGSLQKSISRYETGEAVPSLATLEKLSKALKKTMAYFMEG